MGLFGSNSLTGCEEQNGIASVRNVINGFTSMPRPAVPIPPIVRRGVVSERHANVKLVQRRVVNSAMGKVKHVREKESHLQGQC